MLKNPAKNKCLVKVSISHKLEKKNILKINFKAEWEQNINN